MGYRVAAGMACFGLLPHGSGFWLDSRVASAPACLVHRRSTPCRSRRCMAVECNGLWVGSVRTLLWVAGWGGCPVVGSPMFSTCAVLVSVPRQRGPTSHLLFETCCYQIG